MPGLHLLDWPIRSPEGPRFLRAIRSKLLSKLRVSIDVVPLSDEWPRFLPVIATSVGKGGENGSAMESPKRCSPPCEDPSPAIQHSMCLQILRKCATHTLRASLTDTVRRGMGVTKSSNISSTQCIILATKRSDTYVRMSLSSSVVATSLNS